MKTLYGRVLEAFDDKVVPRAAQANVAPKTFTQLQERDIVVHGRKIFSHYTSTARVMNVFDSARDCREATPEEKDKGAWRVVHGKVCAPPPKDHWAFEDFTTDEIPGTGVEGVKWHATPKSGPERVRWPYRYGEQYGAGGYMHTTMMDAGADIYELVHNLDRRFELSYPWTYFRRGKADWVSLFVPQAVASQYFSRLRAYHWQIATDLGRARPEELEDDDGMRPYVMAQGDAFNVLTKAVLMPEPGTYAPSPTRTPAGSTRPIFDVLSGVGSAATAATSFTLDLAESRYIGDDFQNELGGSWDYQKYLHHAGFEVEKALAMMQIVDPRPTLFTVQRENFLDGRGTKISFRTDLPDAVDRLLGGLLAEDWEAIAPSVPVAPKAPSVRAMQPLDLVRRDAQREAGARVVFPNIGYKQQLAVAIYAAILSRVGGDMTLVNKLRVWLDGDDAPVIPGARQVKLTDPRTGYTYVAARFGEDVVDGKRVDRGIGSRILGHANELLVAGHQVKRDASGDPVLDEAGRPEVLVDAAGQPVVASLEAKTTFERYMGLVDATRQIQLLVGAGPLGGPED